MGTEKGDGAGAEDGPGVGAEAGGLVVTGAKPQASFGAIILTKGETMNIRDRKPNCLGIYLIRWVNEWRATEVAKALKTTPDHIWRIENGEVHPRPEILRRYAKYLGISIESLMRFCDKVSDLESFETLDLAQKQKMRIQHYIDIIQNGEGAA